MNIKKIAAFTLAEILISLAIIGVVASMAMPTLITNQIRKERTAKLKSFYSKMQTAVSNMASDTGEYDDIEEPTNESAFEWYKEHIDPYMGHQLISEASKTIYYKDGSSLSDFYRGGCLDVDYDVNAVKPPNREGKDKFRFLFCFDKANRREYFGDENIFFGSYGSSSITTREEALNSCTTGVHYCSKLLELDNWEFKPDYPHK